MTAGAPPRIRDAVPEDAAACAAVYRPYVLDTAVTFETTAPDAGAWAQRIAAAQRRHAFLVAERDGEVVGFAYGGVLRDRPAYDWSCETTIYLRPGLRRTGTGRALLTALLGRLRDRGLHRAFAVVALPNPASTGLHGALGFRPVARLERVGFKRGAWHDVAWLQCDLRDDPGAPAPRT